MSGTSFGFKVCLGFNNAESIMSLLNLASFKLSRMLELKDITPEHNLTGIEIIDNKDYSYSIIFNFDNKFSADEILNKVITEGITNEY